MSDEKKNEQTKPIKDETLDKVSGGFIVDKPVTPIEPRLPKEPVHGRIEPL